MNIFMIGAMVLIVPMFAGDSIAILNTLSFAVLISGVVQFVFVSFLLWRNGLFPSFSFEALKNIPLLVEFWRLALPSMIGASALQISLLVDKSLACWLGPYAEPALKYSDRIIYFPVGVFAVSFGFVALAEMSRALAANDENRMISTLEFSLRHILFICIPIAFFVFFFREPSIRLMFLGGEFNMKSLEETAYAMFFYSFGIPFFASTKIIVSAFNSRKDTKTPMRVSLFCIGLNIVLNLILMVPLRQGGIALATVLAAVMNNVILLAVLKRRVSGISFGRLWITSLAGAGIALISVLAAKFAYGRLFIFPKTSYLPDNIFPFLISGFLFVFLYTVLSALSGCPEVREISGIFLRRGSNIE
jgi:putative peptidoglycan lipid II flippase